MIFQQPLTDSYSYSATVEKINMFPLHRHYELEFVYCVEGEVCFISQEQKYSLKSGDAAVIGSLTPHEYCSSDDNEVLVAEIGPMLLKSNFIIAAGIGGVVILNNKNSEEYKAIYAELNEIYRIRKSGETDKELYVTGCLYKAVAAAVKYFGGENIKTSAKNKYYDIEEALTLIHTNYHRQLTVKEAAKKAMCAPSNFCAEFKRCTGMGFHEYLNYYRIGIAKFMLEQTDADIKEIAFTTGFSDIKTFYRVFKKETGFPPGEYRRVKN